MFILGIKVLSPYSIKISPDEDMINGFVHMTSVLYHNNNNTVFIIDPNCTLSEVKGKIRIITGEIHHSWSRSCTFPFPSVRYNLVIPYGVQATFHIPRLFDCFQKNKKMIVTQNGNYLFEYKTPIGLDGGKYFFQTQCSS